MLVINVKDGESIERTALQEKAQLAGESASFVLIVITQSRLKQNVA